MANRQHYILDEQLNPVVSGQTGTLYLGGVGLAQQYWQAPAQTAECFIPDPFGHVAGGRIYNTGDRVCLNQYAELIYVGRNDRQIKVNGCRVEPDEIESVLLQQNDVVFAVVSTVSVKNGEDQLMAYVQLQQHSQISEHQLVEYCRQMLPRYMIPAAIKVIDLMPLSVSGKVDIDALSSLHTPCLQGHIIPPANELEVVFMDIWQKVLGKSAFGVCDSFFVLGGHSLIAIKLVNIIASQCGKQISFLDIIAHPTVRLLAGFFNTISYASPSKVITTKLDENQSNDKFDLTPIQLAYLAGNDGCFNYLEIAQTDINETQVNIAINQLIARHDMLRVKFTADGQQYVEPKADPYKIEYYPLQHLPAKDQIKHLRTVQADMTFKDRNFDYNLYE